ncbi:MAG: methyl-accepting chemotaxis protein [Candidatus Omnitrophica bacterium]|nr:methyl-accepting chemotaxis protein [Candidatus Omnitrophota bacterium]MBU0895547.1 methyl-accepting chemotaxis protein [Candidatus Omnitrophota bacterium]MBU1038213.1 methyl-accepting chemotaxis protein [Candidatus Omnitrophota bacterium]MBU1808864.1 methyl-accepting chemotaxis protein [Candidatus Omnitrophota bacterium]
MTQFSKPKFKRTKYLVSTKFQLRYVGIILLLMLVTALICSYIIYYTVMVVMGEKLSNVYPQGRLIAIINIVNLKILFSLLLITPIVAAVGIYLSHKIAGPIYRIEKFLDDMVLGNLGSRIVLRKGDELMSVADKINILNDSLRAIMGGQKSGMNKIVAELDELKAMINSNSGDTAPLDMKVESLQGEIRDLDAQLAKYKI